MHKMDTVLKNTTIVILLLWGVLGVIPTHAAKPDTDRSVVPSLHLEIPGKNWEFYKPENILVLKDLASGGVYFENTTDPSVHGTIHQRLLKVIPGKNMLTSLRSECDSIKAAVVKIKNTKVSYSNKLKIPACIVETNSTKQYLTAKPMQYSSRYYYENVFTFVGAPVPARSLATAKVSKNSAIMNQLVEGAR